MNVCRRVYEHACKRKPDGVGLSFSQSCDKLTQDRIRSVFNSRFFDFYGALVLIMSRWIDCCSFVPSSRLHLFLLFSFIL